MVPVPLGQGETNMCKLHKRTSEAVSLHGSKYHVLRFQGFDLIGRLVNAKRVSRLKEQQIVYYPRRQIRKPHLHKSVKMKVSPGSCCTGSLVAQL